MSTHRDDLPTEPVRTTFGYYGFTGTSHAGLAATDASLRRSREHRLDQLAEKAAKERLRVAPPPAVSGPEKQLERLRFLLATETETEPKWKLRREIEELELRVLIQGLQRFADSWSNPERGKKRVQKRALIEAELHADPQRSNREIARVLGVDHKTVGAVRAEMGME